MDDQLRARRPGLQGVAAILLATCAWDGPVVAQEAGAASARAERFRACPSAGVFVDIHMSIGLGEAPAEPPRAVEVWPDSPDWRALAPPPDSVLLAEESWIAPPSALTAHRRLRDRHHFALPEGRVRVLLFETSSHWVAIETSVAAVRGPDGVWRLDQVKEVKDGAVAAEVEHVEWMLSPEHAARLDALLADPCLAAEPLNTTYSPLGSSQQPRWVLDIQGPDGDLVIGGGDLGFGRAGALHHLLLAP